MRDKMRGRSRRFWFACLLAVAFAGAASGKKTLPPGPGYERAKLYLGPLNSDKWERSWQPRAGRPESDSGGWQAWGGDLPSGSPGYEAATGGGFQYVVRGDFYRNDLVSRRWDSLASMPQDIEDGAAAVIGDTVYIHGGYSYASGELVNRLFKYSISTNHWTSDTGCCLYNWESRMVALDGKLYYMGGCAAPGATDPSVQTWCYTPGTSPCWTRKADMHTGRVFAQAGVHDGKIYMVGGTFENSDGIRETEFYDPVTDAWTQDSALFPYLPSPRWGGAHGCVARTMFIYCGACNGSLAGNALEYSFAAQRWDSVPLMPNGHGTYRSPGVGNSLGQGVVFGDFDSIEYRWVVAYKKFQFTHDVGAIRIDAPAADVDSGDTVRPTAWVKNLGEQPEGFRVMFRIDDGYTQFDSVYVGPGESAQASFPAWIAVQHGFHVATCSTMLAVDENHANDACLKSFTVTTHDLEIISWISPPDTVDSGAVVNPAVVVYNNGTAAEGFRIVLHIGYDYSARESSYLLPGASTNVEFPAWQARYVGWNIIICSLATEHSVRVYSHNVFVELRDAGVDRIIWPVSRTVGQGLNVPRALIHNYGGVRVSIPVEFQVWDSSTGGHMVFADTQRLTLAPGETAVAVFTPWNAYPDVFFGYAAVSLSGDAHPANDRLMNWFRVILESAAPRLSGLYPVDTIPSGPVSPRATITNFGEATGDLQSIFVIGHDTLFQRWAADLILGPGDTANLVYQPDWDATPGYYKVGARVIDRFGRTLDTLSGHVVVVGGAVEEPAGSNLLPRVFALDAPSPNPCRGVATIRYALPQAAAVRVTLYDASGRLAAVLDQGWKNAGRYTAAIRNPQSPFRNPPGVYVCRLEAGSFSSARTLLVLGN